MGEHSNKPVVVATAANELDAAVLIAVINAAGIEAYTEGELTSQFRAEAPGEVRILVREEDFARAREALHGGDEAEPA